MKTPSILILILSLSNLALLARNNLDYAKPEEVGISSDRLSTLHNWMEDTVENYPLTGAVTLLARHGKVADFKTYGYQDRLLGTPMARDSIFRLASMTKTIASAGAMMLVEQGTVQLNDPVEKHLPEFAKQEVFITQGWNKPVTRPAKARMLVRHLLTHTAGFPRGRGGNPELDKLYADSGIADAQSLDEFVAILAELPLQYDPGTDWVYGPSIDVLGALIQRVSGQPFDAYLRKNIFEPLEMEDTFFEVPENKRNRLVSLFDRKNGELAYVVRPEENGKMIRGFPSGGGGLYSTAIDYYKFTQMLLNKGTYQGVSVLGKKTVESMMQNQTGFLGEGPKSNNQSEAYGYGGSVKINTFYEKDISTVGTFGWGGAYTTWYRIDPKEDFIALFFSQQYPMASPLVMPFANTSWQSIVE